MGRVLAVAFWSAVEVIDCRLIGHRCYPLCLRIWYGLHPDEFPNGKPY